MYVHVDTATHSLMDELYACFFSPNVRVQSAIPQQVHSFLLFQMHPL